MLSERISVILADWFETSIINFSSFLFHYFWSKLTSPSHLISLTFNSPIALSIPPQITKQMFVLLLVIWLPPDRHRTLTFPIANFNSCDWRSNSTLQLLLICCLSSLSIVGPSNFDLSPSSVVHCSLLIPTIMLLPQPWVSITLIRYLGRGAWGRNSFWSTMHPNYYAHPIDPVTTLIVSILIALRFHLLVHIFPSLSLIGPLSLHLPPQLPHWSSLVEIHLSDTFQLTRMVLTAL